MCTHVCKYTHLLRNRPRTCSCNCPASWHKRRVRDTVVPRCCTRRRLHIRTCWDERTRRCTCMSTILVCSRKWSCSRRSGVHLVRRRSSIRPHLNNIINSNRVVISFHCAHTALTRRVIINININVITQVNKRNLLIRLVTITL